MADKHSSAVAEARESDVSGDCPRCHYNGKDIRNCWNGSAAERVIRVLTAVVLAVARLNDDSSSGLGK